MTSGDESVEKTATPLLRSEDLGISVLSLFWEVET